jgi:2-oxoisovalerate dehydrogenase E1 component beta subunit
MLFFVDVGDLCMANQRRYHSQSPEALFTHIPGLRVVIPRSPVQAKGLLLAAIECNDPVVFMEPKILYRSAGNASSLTHISPFLPSSTLLTHSIETVEQVPTTSYTLPLSKAEILHPGADVTLISYGHPLYTCSLALEAAERDFGVSVELIDLRTIYPWDRKTIIDSVRKTGRAVIVHESMLNAGVGAEIAASIQEGAFERLEAPIGRVTGWATHMGLVYERFIVPDVASRFSAFAFTHSLFVLLV